MFQKILIGSLENGVSAPISLQDLQMPLSVSTVPVDCKNVSILNIRIQLQKELSPIVHGLAAAIIWICATFFHRCWLTILWANFADQTQIKNQQVFIKAFFCKVLFQIGVNCFRLIWGWDAKNKQRKKRARI